MEKVKRQFALDQERQKSVAGCKYTLKAQGRVE